MQIEFARELQGEAFALPVGGQSAWDARRARRSAQIEAMFRPGAKVTEVAAALGASPSTAATAMRSLGWPIARRGAPKGKRSLNKMQIAFRAQILAAVQAEPHRALASFGEQFGITRERVRQIIAAAGFGAKPKSSDIRAAETKRRKVAEREAKIAARDARNAVALALHLREFTYEQIGREMGICTMAAWRRVQHAKARGITIHEIGGQTAAPEASLAGVTPPPKLAVGRRVRAGCAF